MFRVLSILSACVALFVLVSCGSEAPRGATTTRGDLRGVTTTPGPPPAGGFLEAPTADAPADRPRGVVLVLHGGAWIPSTDAILNTTRQGTDLYRAHGFATYVVRLGGGRETITSATAAYDQVRRRYGQRTPICVIGASSGGHVGLLLAIARPDLACVVVNAAPTDLAQWIDEVPGAAEPVRAAFGTAVRRFSPAKYARRIRARVLLQYAVKDPAVPIAEARTFLRARPRGTTLVTLRPGEAFFIHSGVDPNELSQVAPRQLRFLESAARTPSS